MLAEQNIEVLKEHGVEEDRHRSAPTASTRSSTSTRSSVACFEVIHHTEYLARARQGRPTQARRRHGEDDHVSRPLLQRASQRRMEGAREVIESIPAPSTRSCSATGTRTFCCGAGGGRMWMEERMGKKMNIERTDEALASASDTLAVGCPYCNIMLTDGVTERHAVDRHGGARRRADPARVDRVPPRCRRRAERQRSL